MADKQKPNVTNNPKVDGPPQGDVLGQSKLPIYIKVLEKYGVIVVPKDCLIPMEFQDDLVDQKATKNLKDYSVIVSDMATEHRIMTKFIDPLNNIIMDVNEFIETFKVPRVNNGILMYDYPVVKDGKFAFCKTLFKIDYLGNEITKFNAEEVKYLNFLAGVMFATSQSMREADISKETTQKYFDELICSITYIDLKLELEPGIYTVTPDAFLEVIGEGDTIVAFIARDGDCFTPPSMFDCKLAKLYNKTAKIINDPYIMELFLNNFDIASFKSIDAKLLAAKEALADNAASTSKVENSDKDKLNLSALTLSTSDDSSNSTGLYEYTCLGQTFKYPNLLIVVEPNVAIYKGMSQKDYFSKYLKSNNRLVAMDLNKVVLKKGSGPIPIDVLAYVVPLPIEIVDKFNDAIMGKLGIPLIYCVAALLNDIDLDKAITKRVEFDHFDSCVAHMYVTHNNRGLKSTLAKMVSKNLLNLYWAMSNMKEFFNLVGIHETATVTEMSIVLKIVDPAMFGRDLPKPLIDTPVVKPVTHAMVAEPIAMQTKLAVEVQAVKPKKLAKAPAVKNLSSVLSKTTITNVGDKSTRTGESGYRSVSTGDRFSKASSYGENCIKGQRSVIYVPKINSADMAQNIITFGTDFISSNMEHIWFEDGAFQFMNWLNNPLYIVDQAVHVNKQDSFQRLYPRDKVLVNTNIVFSQPLTDDIMPISLLDSLISGNVVDSRKIAGQIGTQLRCKRRYSELLAPLLDRFTERFSLVAVYTIGYILMFMLADLEEQEIDPVFGDIPENSIKVYNFAIDENDIPAAAMDLEESLADGRIFMSVRDLNTVDSSVMKLITAGPSVIGVDNFVDYAHVGSSIRAAGCAQWAIFSDREFNLPNNVGRVNSAHVNSFLAKLTSRYGDKDAAVAGMINASCILNGKIKELNRYDMPINRFIMSTLEIGQINLPRASGHNWMWKELRIEPARSNAPYFTAEYESIRNSNAAVLNRVSVITALYVSLGISTFLDHMNITGRDISDAVLPPENNNNLIRIIEDASRMKNGLGAPILTVGSSFSTQFSDIIINPRVWNGRHWCDQFNNIRQIGYDINDLWGGIWDEYIPYLFEPLAASFLLSAWPSVWGILAPEVTFEVTQEVNMLGPQEMRLWDATLGSKNYETNAIGKTPWVKEGYGQMIINAFRQQFGVLNPWEINQQIYMGVGNKFIKSGDTDAYQPEYDEDFGIIKIGTLLTWRWSIMRNIVPSLRPAVIGDRLFHTMAHAHFNNMNSAGIYLNAPQSGFAVNTGIFNEAGIGGMDYYSAAGSSSSRISRSEN